MERRSGKTTRQIDQYIQDFFTEDSVTITDKEEALKFTSRLFAEHPDTHLWTTPCEGGNVYKRTPVGSEWLARASDAQKIMRGMIDSEGRDRGKPASEIESMLINEQLLKGGWDKLK